jgi:glyoxylase-like metal-dependent hydrolase (beta-lactamase superfamily II)
MTLSLANLSRRTVLGAAAALVAGADQLAAQTASAAFGTAKLGILSDGTITLPGTFLARGAPRAEVEGLLAGAGLPTDVVTNSLNVPVVTQGDDVVMFDCGAGKNFLPSTGMLPDSMSAAGIDAATVKHVFLTHAHPDHIWGALDEFDTPACANATYHLPQAEWDFWMDPGVFAKLPEDRQAFAAGAQRVLKALEPQLKRFRPGQEVVSGVAAIDTAGHTPGHVCFEVRLGGEPFVVIGDAFTHPVVSFARPDWSAGFDQDGEKAAVSRRKLMGRLAAERLPFTAYHLPKGGIGRVEAAGSAFRYVPA